MDDTNQVYVRSCKDIIEITRDAIVCSDETGSIRLWNRAAEQMFGYSEDEARGQPLSIIIPNDMRHKHMGRFKHFLNTGELTSSGKIIEVLALKKDGSTFPVELSLSPIKTAHGWNVVAIVRDITERMQTNILVKQTADILEMIATGQPASGIYDEIALMYEGRHPGMRCSVLILQGDKLMHGGAPSLPAEYCNAVNGLKNGPDIGSCGTSTYTGKRVLVEDIASDPKWANLKAAALPHGLRCCWSEPIKNASGKVLGAFGMYYNHPALPTAKEIIDLESAARLAGIVMEREQRDRYIRKLFQAVEHAGESILITDVGGVIEYINPAFTRMTGYTAEEAIGQTPRILNSGNQDVDFYKNMWDTIINGNVWHGKIIDKKKDGSFYPAMLTISPVQDSDGIITNYTAFIGIQSDLSEVEALEKQFQQAQKMEAIGTLVGGIAHDFNNMLAGIICNLYLIKANIAQMPDMMKNVARIESTAFRASAMVQQLLTFARKDRIEIKPLSFPQFVKETLKLLRAMLPENIEREGDICIDDLKIEGDATQLHQVMMNLINNARDAMEGVENPHISIRLASFQPDDAFMKKKPYFKVDKQYAHLSIEDNGYGMSKKDREHIFEPFYTTKEVGKGTGLGLAMVYGAIKSHHGFIEVDSKIGKGTTFHIYLPLIEDDEISSALSQRGQALKGHGEVILLVDDERLLCETSAEVLEAMGYKVLQAYDGQEAMSIFEAHKENVAIAILDLIMPHVGGIQLAIHIREMRPDIPIIFVTGYDKEHALSSNAQISNSKILNKPVRFEDLSYSIRELLN